MKAGTYIVLLSFSTVCFCFVPALSGPFAVQAVQASFVSEVSILAVTSFAA